MINQAAITVGPLVEILNRADAEVSKIVPKLLEILLAQHLSFLAIGTPGHDQQIVAYSPYIRPSRIRIKTGLKRNRFELHHPAEAQVRTGITWRNIMAANPSIIPQAKVAPDKQTIQIAEPNPLTLKKRVRDLLIEMLEGYQEFLGWTPD
jgi:hypothetical protein